MSFAFIEHLSFLSTRELSELGVPSNLRSEIEYIRNNSGRVSFEDALQEFYRTSRSSERLRQLCDEFETLQRTHIQNSNLRSLSTSTTPDFAMFGPGGKRLICITE